MPSFEVVIFFVGLTVFSDQIPNDCGVKAILPLVAQPTAPVDGYEQHSSVHREPFLIAQGGPPPVEQRRDGSATQRSSPQLPPSWTLGPKFDADFKHVEDHDAVIVFRATAYHPSSSWGPVEAVRDATGTPTLYSFVRLDGDRVRFQAASSTQPLTSIGGIVLPSLANELCPARVQSLGQSYLPPYDGAAAVFDLPRGILTSCLSTRGTESRLDTRLALDASGPFFVVSASTMKVRKELRLRPPTSGPVELLVANVPKRTLKGDLKKLSPHLNNGMEHDQAYYAMGASNTGACSKTIQQWFAQKQAAGLLNVTCSLTSLPQWKPVPGSTPPVVAPPPIMSNVLAASFECSNTRWP